MENGKNIIGSCYKVIQTSDIQYICSSVSSGNHLQRMQKKTWNLDKVTKKMISQEAIQCDNTVAKSNDGPVWPREGIEEIRAFKTFEFLKYKKKRQKMFQSLGKKRNNMSYKSYITTRKFYL